MIGIYLLAFSIVIAFAALFRLGGAGTPPLGKNWRRLGMPLVLIAWGLLAGVAWYWVLASAALLWLVTILPITLIGSDLDDAGQLWWWIHVLGLAYGGSLVPLGLFDRWLAAILVGVSIGFMYWFLVFLSQLKGGQDTKWNWYEIIFGGVYGIGAVLIVYSGRFGA